MTAIADPARQLCSDADLAAGDDLRGTAALFDTFVVVEQRGSFGREAAADAFRAADPDAADELLAVPGLRPFAIRPVGRPESQGVRPRYLGRSGPDGSLHEIDDLPDPASLAAQARRRGGLDPVFGVCTNGSRDRCCAVKSRELAVLLHRELDGGESGDDACVVEISHLGGHRFAPTMLVLPTGYAYGRLDADTALEIAWAAQDGLVHPDNIRGRADLPPAAQVADAYWRAELGDPQPIDVVTSLRLEADGPGAVVTALVQGRSETLLLRLDPGQVIAETACGGKPIATGRWRVSSR